MSDQTPPNRIAELENRIEQLEATTKKMMPTRRDALKFGGAAAIGAAAMSGTASAGSAQVGTIGDSNNLVDVEAEDINVSDTINGASVSGAANGEALTSDGSGGLTFAQVGGGIPANFSYVDQLSNRSFGTTFTNSTGSVLYVAVTTKTFQGSNFRLKANVDNQEIKRVEAELLGGGDFSDSTTINIDIFVPNGSTYDFDDFRVDPPLFWYEAEM